MNEIALIARKRGKTKQTKSIQFDFFFLLLAFIFAYKWQITHTI